MKKRKIVSILVFNLLLLEGINLKSEEVIDGTATVNLGETVVPRKKIGRDGNLEEKFSKSNKNYTQKITENEIKESGASNIFELLQKTTTLNIKNGFIGTGVIDLRGYGETAFGNTKILLDGISINPIDGSGIDINSIPLENIKLIEIINGGSGVLYGDGSTGGVINIVTKDIIQNDNYKIESYISTNDTFNEKLDINKIISKNTTVNFGIEKKDSDGYRVNSDLDEWNIYSGIVQKINDNILIKGKYSYLNSKRGLPGSVSEENMQLYGRTYGDPDDNLSRIKNNLLFDILYSKNDLEIESILGFQTRKTRGEYLDTYFPYIRTDKENSFNINTKVTYNYNSYSNILFGIDASEGKIKTETNYDSANNEKKSLGVYILNTNNYNNFIFKEGIRVENTRYGESINKKYNSNAYELSMGYKYSDTGKIYLGYNSSFRTPNIDEINPLYGLGEKFKIQKNNEFELGVSDYYKGNTIDINVFYVNTKNEIYYNPSGGYGFGSNENIDGKTTRYGAEVKLGQKYDKFNLKESMTLLNTKIDDGIYKYSEIPGTSKVIFNLGGDYFLTDKLQLSANYSYRSSQYAISDFYNKKEKQKSYSVTNFDLKYDINSNFGLQVGINNVFNNKYNDYTVYSTVSDKLVSYPSDERIYYIKFDYTINGGK